MRQLIERLMVESAGRMTFLDTVFKKHKRNIAKIVLEHVDSYLEYEADRIEDEETGEKLRFDMKRFVREHKWDIADRMAGFRGVEDAFAQIITNLVERSGASGLYGSDFAEIDLGRDGFVFSAKYYGAEVDDDVEIPADTEDDIFYSVMRKVGFPGSSIGVDWYLDTNRDGINEIIYKIRGTYPFSDKVAMSFFQRNFGREIKKAADDGVKKYSVDR